MTRKPLFFYAMVFSMMTSAGCAGTPQAPGEGKSHREGSYFEVSLPEGWHVQTGNMGLSPEEKKIYGIALTAPYDPKSGSGSVPRISAHYYAPGNLLDETPELYTRSHSIPEGAAPAALPALPKVRDAKVGGLKAGIFVNITHERGAERRLNAKSSEVWECFAVIPLKKGYYALRYSAPAARYDVYLPVFEAFIASFRPLLK